MAEVVEAVNTIAVITKLPVGKAITIPAEKRCINNALDITDASYGGLN